jgi:hypothetical protein
MRSLLQSSAGPPGPTLLQNSMPGLPFRPEDRSSVRGHQPFSSQPSTIPLHSQPYPPSNSPPNPFFSIQNDSLSLSSHAKGNVTRAIQGGWATATLNRYTGSIKQFIRFCDEERVPENLRFPTDEFILCAFAASSFGRHAGGTPRSRITALKAWHLTHNVEWKGSARLRYVLNGVHNFTPGTSKRPPRPPITVKMLSQLIENLNLDSPFDAAVAACATTAFWGQCCLGELLPCSSSPLSLSSLPTCSDFKRSKNNPQSFLLHLPTTKTHRHGEDVVLVDQEDRINPISLLMNHIRVNAIPQDVHIFSYTASGKTLSLTRDCFMQRCNTIWSSLGYPRTTGHCFRIGGTTELLVAGVPPDIVKVTGRWSSESFLRYWRSLDEIVPIHIRNLHTTKRRLRRP